jgi:hypothetical protein
MANDRIVKQKQIEIFMAYPTGGRGGWLRQFRWDIGRSTVSDLKSGRMIRGEDTFFSEMREAGREFRIKAPTRSSIGAILRNAKANLETQRARRAQRYWKQ